VYPGCQTILSANSRQEFFVNLESGALKLVHSKSEITSVEGVGNSVLVVALDSVLSDSELDAGRRLLSRADVSLSTEWFEGRQERQLALDVQWPASFDVAGNEKLLSTSLESLRTSELQLVPRAGSPCRVSPDPTEVGA